MTIIWDWNGTLLDDVEVMIASDNRVFERRGLRRITLEEYRHLFRHPVADFYAELGITGDAFRQVSREWLEEYTVASKQCGLRGDAADTLRCFHAAGFRQALISASPAKTLHEQVARYPELNGMLDDVLGLGDIYAASKVTLAGDYLRSKGIHPADTVFLGDTTHDAEVAQAAGCRCLLISGGHQEDAALHATGMPVLPSLAAAAELLGA